MVKNCLSYKGSKLRLRCSKCRQKENCGPKSVVAKANNFYPYPLIVTARPKTET